MDYDLSGEPQLEQMNVLLAQIPGVNETMVARIEALALRYIEATERAAGGDEEAAAELGVAFFDIHIAMTEVELQTYES